MDPYVCIRCGYSTQRKDCMRRHLHTLKNNCPGQRVNIELTDEIKDCILKNRVFKPPQEPQQNNVTINQQINNFHQIKNIVSEMDIIDKISKYAAHTQQNILDFDDKVEECFKDKVRLLESGNTKRVIKLDMLDVLDTACNIKGEVDKLNVVYDEKSDKIKFYESGMWNTFLSESGMKEYIEKIKCNYFDVYECYLIRKYKNSATSPYDKNIIKNLVFDYYRFLVCFEITPFVSGKNDYKVLYNYEDPRYSTEVAAHEFDRFSIENEFMDLFKKARRETTRTEAKTKGKVTKDILKRNTNTNETTLDQKILDVMQHDNEFRAMIVDTYTHCRQQKEHEQIESDLWDD